MAIAVALTTDVRTERTSDNIDPCREVTGSTTIPPGCGAFENTCAAYTMEPIERAFEEYQNRLVRADIGGVSFPRTARTQFRGIRDSMEQFTVPKVLRAIGGDPTPAIGSRLHWLAQSVLMKPEMLAVDRSLLAPLRVAYRRHIFGRPTLFSDIEQVFREHGILADVRTLLACHTSYNERDAAVYAKDLSLKALRYLESKWGEKFTRYLFTYDTGEFDSYGDYKGAIHFYSTSSPSIAHAYGSKILVFANAANKTLDLNYWNFRLNNGIWSYHDADRSEFVTAINVEPDAVLGIWKTDESNRDVMGRDTTMRPRVLSYALMRLDMGGIRYAVILDARTSDCVMQTGSHFEGCHDGMTRQWGLHKVYDESQVEFGPLIPDGKPLPVVAVVRACAVDDNSCGISDTVFAEMPAAARRLTAVEQREIVSASFRIDGRLFVQSIRSVPSAGNVQPARHAGQ